VSIVLISYTAINAPGGVPRWNRDFMSWFPGTRHYSWWDTAKALGIPPEIQSIPEWEKAKLTSKYLLSYKLIKEDDIVIGDNWWVDGLEHRERTISVAHGNWSHTTLEDVHRGIPPEFPVHAEQQLAFRKRYFAAGRKLVAVSDFIAHEMARQWGFHAYVINNGIDLEKFKPAEVKIPRKRPIIIHFTTTANKGLDHIEAVKREVGADVWLLDEAAEKLGLPKYEALAQADLVVHPSSHEGASMAVLETLACDVPIVSYSVGQLWKGYMDEAPVGELLNRNIRSSATTVEATMHALRMISDGWKCRPREWVSQFSIQNFHATWREYLEKEFGYEVRLQ
jgi:glycosyltransferase involved in cell wall biosynthesis